MANWLQIPGGRVINGDNVVSIDATGRTFSIQMVDGSTVATVYDSSAAAFAARDSVQTSLLNPTSGSPTLSAISPNSIPANGDYDLTVTGTNFRTSAIISLGTTALPTTFVSTTTLQATWTGFLLAGGTYDVVYSDAAGGSNTLTAAFTVT